MRISARYLDGRLDEWADWSMLPYDNGLGYPKKTIEARLHEQGGVLISGTGARHEPTNERAEEIEFLLLELHKHDQRLSMSLRTYYLGDGLIQHKAKKAGFSYSQFKVFVDMGRAWMAGRLSAKR